MHRVCGFGGFKPLSLQDDRISQRWISADNTDNLLLLWCLNDADKSSVELRRLVVLPTADGCKVKAEKSSILFKGHGDQPSGRAFLAQFYKDYSVAVVRASGSSDVFHRSG